MRKGILIIDDDKEFCEELSEILKHEGYGVEYRSSPEEGIRLLKTGAYGLLLLDFKMPRMSGVEFLKKYREDLKGVKIFMVTGSLTINKLLLGGGVFPLVAEVFNKPFDPENFIQKIKEALPLNL